MTKKIHCKIEKSLHKTIAPWQVSSGSKEIQLLEKTGFWKKWESSLTGKKVHEIQTISTTSIFRCLILEDVFYIDLNKIEKEIEKVKILDFACNLKQMLPSKTEIKKLRDILIDHGYYDVIIDKCQTYTKKEKNIEEIKKLSIHTGQHQLPSNPHKCPHCKSTYIFKKRASIINKLLFTQALYSCSECNTSFRKQPE